MNILDVRRILDFDRYQKIDVNARDPRDVYPAAAEMAPEKNLSFFTKCVRQFPVLRLADRDTARVYARVESGRLAWRDSAACAAIADSETVRALRAVVPEVLAEIDRDPPAAPEYLDPERYLTIGRWGTARPS